MTQIKQRTEHNTTGANSAEQSLPCKAIRHYLIHAGLDWSIRKIARGAKCHPSTVLRQIKQIELRRSDPLFNAAIETAYAAFSHRAEQAQPSVNYGKAFQMTLLTNQFSAHPRSGIEVQEIHSILTKLSEPNAILAIADSMEKAVVVREDRNGQTVRTGIVDCHLAQYLSIKKWVACDRKGKISRFRITSSGTKALLAMGEAVESEKAPKQQEFGFAEAPAGFDMNRASSVQRLKRPRYSDAETPVSVLARRKDKTGKPFLTAAQVAAADRLRTDYVLAELQPQSGDYINQNASVQAAKERLDDALTTLGAGLSDVALRVCCMLEGVEAAEKSLGWSARSAKIVLRIALQQLVRHYEKNRNKCDFIG